MPDVYSAVESSLSAWDGTFHPDHPLVVDRIDECPFPTKKEEMTGCNPINRFRTLDGSCNNLEHPLWGKSFRPMGRFLPAVYGDSECSSHDISLACR